jgi:NAD(P)-dependent dehydrogenase (short-subunit alcohol dehydrogenase family)
VSILGGARGITAELVTMLARHTGCAIELVGRSALPEEPEDEALAPFGDLRSLRGALARAGHRDPREIETTATRLLAAREMRATMAALAAAGSRPMYHQIDARDAGALTAVVESIYARHGRLDGVVHGAGVMVNELIESKSTAVFDDIFSTKVEPIRTLLRCLRPDLGFLVLFGSLVSAHGNRGQVDYAAANDALTTIALASCDRARRVLAVDWGPWDPRTGMVTPALARLWENAGMGMLQPDDGMGCLLADLAGTGLNHLTIVRALPALLAAEEVATVAAQPARAWPTDVVTFERHLSVDTMPETLDHCLIRQREGWTNLEECLPAVAMTRQLELLEEIAQEFDPTRTVVELRQVRNFKWLDLSHPIDLEVTVAPVDDDTLRVALGEYTKAKVVFGAPRGRGTHERRPMADPRPARYSPEEIFAERLLFHGPRYRGIARLGPLDGKGIEAEVLQTTTPGCLLDSVGKVVAYWAMEQLGWGEMALPIGVDRVTFFGPRPAVGNRVHLEIGLTRIQRDQLIASAWLVDEDNGLWCEIEGWRSVVVHMNERDEAQWRWPERYPSVLTGPRGLRLQCDDWHQAARRELYARRALRSSDRARWEGSTPADQRRLQLEQTTVRGSVAHEIVHGHGIEVFPAEIDIEPIGEGRWRATCQLLPDKCWDLAYAASDDLGVAVAFEHDILPAGSDVRAPAIAIRLCTDDEDELDVTSAVVQDVVAASGGQDVDCVVHTTTSPSEARVAIAWTPHDEPGEGALASRSLSEVES